MIEEYEYVITQIILNTEQAPELVDVVNNLENILYLKQIDAMEYFWGELEDADKFSSIDKAKEVMQDMPFRHEIKMVKKEVMN